MLPCNSPILLLTWPIPALFLLFFLYFYSFQCLLPDQAFSLSHSGQATSSHEYASIYECIYIFHYTLSFSFFFFIPHTKLAAIHSFMSSYYSFAHWRSESLTRQLIAYSRHASLSLSPISGRCESVIEKLTGDWRGPERL